MYDRPDVPRPSRHRTVIAVIVIVVLVVGIAVGVRALWGLANHDPNQTLADPALAQELTHSSSLEVTAPDGYHLTGHSLTNIVIFRVGDVNTDASMDSCLLLSIDKADSKGELVTIPADLSIMEDGSAKPLSTVFNEKGAASCLMPLAQALDLPIEHVVTLDDSGWQLVQSTAKAGTRELVTKAPELLGVVHSDMDLQTLVSVFESMHSIGFSHLKSMDLPMTAGEDGSQTVDRTALAVDVGALAKD